MKDAGGQCRSRFGLSGHPVGHGDSVSLFYKGLSMNPLLTTPDLLYVKPYRETEVCRGDVVVFRSPDGDFKVVHRVVCVNVAGVRTKGDSNSHIDSWILKPEDIIGRVERIERAGRTMENFWRPPGTAQAGAVKAVRLIDAGACAVLRPLYARLARSRVLKRWLAERSLTRVISISGRKASNCSCCSASVSSAAGRPAGATGTSGAPSSSLWMRTPSPIFPKDRAKPEAASHKCVSRGSTPCTRIRGRLPPRIRSA